MIYKFTKLFADYEKEEKWLNEMSQKGYAFKGYSPFRYTFEDEEPSKYTYRIQLLENLPSHVDSVNYIEFCEELGVDVVDTSGRWVYFRKLSKDGIFEIHSDLESKIKHHKSIRAITSISAISNFVIAMSNFTIGIITKFNLWFGLVSFLVFIGLAALSYKQHLRIKEIESEQLID
jgi:hypothetical protein